MVARKLSEASRGIVTHWHV